MGRKPNALITEFFVRGRKLQDSSNRYHMTCRACHQEFPKGRIDGLSHHLIKKCPAISTEQRKRVARLVDAGRREHGGWRSGPEIEMSGLSRHCKTSPARAIAQARPRENEQGHGVNPQSVTISNSSETTVVHDADHGTRLGSRGQLQSLLPVNKPIETPQNPRQQRVSFSSTNLFAQNTLDIEITDELLSDVKPISWIVPWGSSEVLPKADV